MTNSKNQFYFAINEPETFSWDSNKQFSIKGITIKQSVIIANIIASITNKAVRRSDSLGYNNQGAYFTPSVGTFTPETGEKYNILTKAEYDDHMKNSGFAAKGFFVEGDFEIIFSQRLYTKLQIHSFIKVIISDIEYFAEVSREHMNKQYIALLN